MNMEELSQFQELNEFELDHIDGGKLPGWAGFVDQIYDFGYGVGQGFARTAKKL